MTLDVLADAVQAAHDRRLERLLEQPTAGTVHSQHESGGLMIQIDGYGEDLHGPCAWQQPIVATESADGHTHGLEQTVPPRGTRCLVLEAASSEPLLWIVGFDGWPRS